MPYHICIPNTPFKVYGKLFPQISGNDGSTAEAQVYHGVFGDAARPRNGEQHANMIRIIWFVGTLARNSRRPESLKFVYAACKSLPSAQ